MKKNYIYIQRDGKVKVKNLGIVKKSTSKLSKKIFWEKLVPLIKERKEVKFTKALIKKFILEELEKDIGIMALRKDVKPYSYYEETSPTGIQAQISKKYGDGVHFMIVNNKFGVGKKKKYCTLEEFKEKGMKINDLILDNIYRELKYFTKQQQTQSLLAFT